MTILLDPGHGKNTPGKKSPYSLHSILPSLSFEEWRFNRDIAQRVYNGLISFGYKCEILVKETEDISLKERCNRANKYPANDSIFISIHANAHGRGTGWTDAKGWCAFTTKGVTKSDKLCESIYCAAERYFKGRKIRYDRSDGDSDWEENFYVIKNTKMPAVLIENFFYTNIEDTLYLLSEEGRQAITNTIVDGIISYLQNEK